MSKSSKAPPRRKATTTDNPLPQKPYRDFPLTAHRNGQWCKKIKGRLCYFGTWADWQSAVDEYNRVKDDLYAGRKPRPKTDDVTIKELLNRFLTSKKHELGASEITTTTFKDYHKICTRIKDHFGLSRAVADIRSDDLEGFRATLAKGIGPVTLKKQMAYCRAVFNYAFDTELIDRPLPTKKAFKLPSKRVLRVERNKHGDRLYTPEQIKLLLQRAGTQLKAMIWLGLNCGFSPADCGRLPVSAIDFTTSWITYPRFKTGIQRRCPLWPETIQAIHDVIDQQRPRKDEVNNALVFITKYGDSWHKEESHDTPISNEFRKLADETGVYRRGLTFYALRHTFETIGGDSRDQVAVDFIMGHAKEDMASLYREGISDDRLLDVVNHVHNWLFENDVAS